MAEGKTMQKVSTGWSHVQIFKSPAHAALLFKYEASGASSPFWVIYTKFSSHTPSQNKAKLQLLKRVLLILREFCSDLLG